MKLDAIPFNHARIAYVRFSPEGDVLAMRLRPSRRAIKEERAKEPVPHRPNDPACRCEDCQILFQAADR